LVPFKVSFSFKVEGQTSTCLPSETHPRLSEARVSIFKKKRGVAVTKSKEAVWEEDTFTCEKLKKARKGRKSQG
jgi:hypothetical protein